MNPPKNKVIGLSLDEKRALLIESLKQLNGHPGFEAFMAAIYELREAAIAAALTHDVVGNIGRARASLGEIRAYEDIAAIVSEHISETT
jgi:hypothetical protein